MSSKYLLQLQDLKITVEKEIIHDLNLNLRPGEIHVIMGPNGSGKSTLSNAIMGHPKYKLAGGKILLSGEDISNCDPSEKAKKGLFLSMQYIPEIPGVTVANFLRLSVSSVSGNKLNPIKFYSELKEKMAEIGIDPVFADRYLNVGFSGGEKKKLEILQLKMLNPKVAILDETDSGLDIDSLKVVSSGINQFHAKDKAILLITHYSRILKYVQPDFVHVLNKGSIVAEGGPQLAQEIEKNGYAALLGKTGK
jgi:Fe-S cluster assembly ATP-binding protein